MTKKEHYVVSYPIYDWETEDVWTANAKFGYKYNKLYDLMYQSRFNHTSNEGC